MPDAIPALPARHADGWFGPGNPGRPVGAYNRGASGVAQTVFEHFQANHKELLESMAYEPVVYVQLLTYLLPRRIEIDTPECEAMSDADVARDR